jgi:hypothetical protein
MVRGHLIRVIRWAARAVFGLVVALMLAVGAVGVGEGLDASAATVLLAGCLLAIVGGTWAVVETVAVCTGRTADAVESCAARLVEAMPSAEAIAARAVLQGHDLARQWFEGDADVAKISDFRR